MSELVIHATTIPIISPVKITAHHTFNQNKTCCNVNLLIKHSYYKAFCCENY